MVEVGQGGPDNYSQEVYKTVTHMGYKKLTGAYNMILLQMVPVPPR